LLPGGVRRSGLAKFSAVISKTKFFSLSVFFFRENVAAGTTLETGNFFDVVQQLMINISERVTKTLVGFIILNLRCSLAFAVKFYKR
jgi:hypothetical protein